MIYILSDWQEQHFIHRLVCSLHMCLILSRRSQCLTYVCGVDYDGDDHDYDDDDDDIGDDDEDHEDDDNDGYL